MTRISTVRRAHVVTLVLPALVLLSVPPASPLLPSRTPNAVETDAAGRVVIATRSLPAGTVGVAYRAALTARDGTPPYTWAVAGGTLPPGLNLGKGGVLAGTPRAGGTFRFTVRLSDSSRPAQTAQQALSITMAVKRVAITTTSVPAGTVGVAYRAALTARDGTPPYTWSVAGGTLPPGLTLGKGGVLAGTSRAGGTFRFTVRLSDSSRPAQTAQQALSVTMAVKRVAITTTSVPAGTVGVGYNAALTARDGTPPYRWSLGGGRVPPGLSLAEAGAMTGAPTDVGTFRFTVRVRDSSRPAQTAQQALSVTVTSPPDRTFNITYNRIVWTARLARGRLEVQGAGQGSWGRKWSHVASNVTAFQQGVGTDQGPIVIYTSGGRWHITQLNWASGAPQNRRSFTQPIVVMKPGQYGVTMRVGTTCYDYSWNALKEINCKTGALIRVIR